MVYKDDLAQDVSNTWWGFALALDCLSAEVGVLGGS